MCCAATRGVDDDENLSTRTMTSPSNSWQQKRSLFNIFGRVGNPAKQVMHACDNMLNAGVAARTMVTNKPHMGGLSFIRHVHLPACAEWCTCCLLSAVLRRN